MKKSLLFLISIVTISLVGCNSNSSSSEISSEKSEEKSQTYYRYFSEKSYVNNKYTFAINSQIVALDTIETPNGYIVTSKDKFDYETIKIENDVFTYTRNKYEASGEGTITLNYDTYNKYLIGYDEKEYFVSISYNTGAIINYDNLGIDEKKECKHGGSMDSYYVNSCNYICEKQFYYSNDCICLNAFHEYSSYTVEINAYYISLEYAQRNNIEII